MKCSYKNGFTQLCLALCITSDNIDYDAWIMPYQQHRCSPGAYLHSKSKWKTEISNKFWVFILHFIAVYFLQCWNFYSFHKNNSSSLKFPWLLPHRALMKMHLLTYSRVPNKQTGCLLRNEKKIPDMLFSPANKS